MYGVYCFYEFRIGFYRCRSVFYCVDNVLQCLLWRSLFYYLNHLCYNVGCGVYGSYGLCFDICGAVFTVLICLSKGRVMVLTCDDYFRTGFILFIILMWYVSVLMWFQCVLMSPRCWWFLLVSWRCSWFCMFVLVLLQAFIVCMVFVLVFHRFCDLYVFRSDVFSVHVYFMFCNCFSSGRYCLNCFS